MSLGVCKDCGATSIGGRARCERCRNADPIHRTQDAVELFFDGHACLTGDCPHQTQKQCLEASAKDGADWRLNQVLEKLRSDKARKEIPNESKFGTVGGYAADWLERELRK
jgi:hypothetical protein